MVFLSLFRSVNGVAVCPRRRCRGTERMGIGENGRLAKNDHTFCWIDLELPSPISAPPARSGCASDKTNGHTCSPSQINYSGRQERQRLEIAQKRRGEGRPCPVSVLCSASEPFHLAPTGSLQHSFRAPSFPLLSLPPFSPLHESPHRRLVL